MVKPGERHSYCTCRQIELRMCLSLSLSLALSLSLSEWSSWHWQISKTQGGNGKESSQAGLVTIKCTGKHWKSATGFLLPESGLSSFGFLLMLRWYAWGCSRSSTLNLKFGVYYLLKTKNKSLPGDLAYCYLSSNVAFLSNLRLLSLDTLTSFL